MRLVLHIVRKDCLRLRWPLAGWLLVVVTRLGIGFSLVLSGGFLGLVDERIDSMVKSLHTIELLLTFVLTAMLVQEDSLVGATQFWLTRPISGGRLLAGKIVGWLLMLWLSAVVVTLPWWLTCGFGGREILWAALELLAVQAAISVPAALIAGLTDSLGRVLIWAFVLVLAVGTIPVALSTLVNSRSTVASSPIEVVIWCATLLVVAAAVAVHQFFRRDVVRSMVWLGMGVAVSALVTFVVPWPLTAEFLKPKWTNWHPEKAKGVALALDSAFSPGPRRAGDPEGLYSGFEVKGVPDGLVLASNGYARQTWSWPGGPVVTRDGWVNGAWGDTRGIRSALGIRKPQTDDETESYLTAQWRATHPGAKPANISPKVQEATVQVEAEVFPSTVTRIRQTPPAYEASVQLRLLRPELWLEVPLTQNTWQAHAGHGFRILPLIRVTGGAVRPTERATDQVAAHVPLVSTAPDFLGDLGLILGLAPTDDWNGAGIFVLHRTAGMLEGKNISTSREFFLIGSVKVQRTTITLWQPRIRRDGKWVLKDARWVEGVTVVAVGFQEEARFTADVKAERYELSR